MLTLLSFLSLSSFPSLISHYCFKKSLKSKNASVSSRFLSVIIAGKNEAKHLPQLIQALQQQSYADFEVIYINDHSTDDTVSIFKRLTENDNRFLIFDAVSKSPRKKDALKQAIQQAKHERLVFTDADCLPPQNWLLEIAKQDTWHPEAVFVGYSPVVEIQNLKFKINPPSPLYQGGATANFPNPKPQTSKQLSTLNSQLSTKFQTYETAFTAWKTAAAIGMGYAYMAVGRNLSYPKSLFQKVGGFDERLLSGDDDLFVQQARKFAPVLYLSHPDTFVPTDAQPTFKAYIKQKQRHFSTGKVYDRKPQIVVALFHLSHLLTLLAPIFMGWKGWIIIALQHFMGLWISYDLAKTFHQPQLFTWHNLNRYLYLLLQVASPLLGVLRKEKW